MHGKATTMKKATNPQSAAGRDVPVVLRITQALMLLSALFSFIAAAVLFTTYPAIFGASRLLIAAALMVTVVGISNRRKWAFSLGIALTTLTLIGNIIPNISWAGLLVNAALFIFLFTEKSYFTE